MLKSLSLGLACTCTQSRRHKVSKASQGKPRSRLLLAYPSWRRAMSPLLPISRSIGRGVCVDERRRGWVLLLLRLELPLARAQCPVCVWSFTARYSHRLVFWWWVVGLVPLPFPKAWLALRGAMSPPRRAAAAGQDSKKCWFFHLPTLPPPHTNTGGVAARQGGGSRGINAPAAVQSVHLKSSLHPQLCLALLRVYLAVRRLTHCNPPLQSLHRTSTMLLQRGVLLSCLLASAVAFAPSVRAPRAVSCA